MLDRNLGNSFEEALKVYGLKAFQMREIWPGDGGQVIDTDWIRRSAEEGWIVFSQDARLAKNKHELAAIREHGAKVFCLNRADLRVATKAFYFGRHILTIARRSEKPGPALWRIDANDIRKDLQ